ncbi:pPIWI_RE module domain-containing protein [Micromonospora sp. CB01531]|uniref:pPIWI_RE module domain-containing protein n=1 Tax=Micromonospora sp. CB01531 TaxID=1718947 RepID=UPI00093D1DD5|nr:DUF3962 domain-containing protein [Micromonospora sp. CB01531]OKI61666.1 hypothetical protein A6A27_27725 [Micromonospora sp. CB01531]
MRYDHTQTAAFVAARDLKIPLHTLTFPVSWRRPILDLYTAGWREESRARAQQVPIGRLNALMRTAAPDLVSTATRANLDEGNPWLFAAKPFPPAIMRTFINAWLYDLPTTDDGKALVLPAITKLGSGTLQWTQKTVDLLAHELSDGNTAVPQPHLFTLLPDYAAAKIAGQSYHHGSKSIRFRQVATNPANGYAELVSWPPLEHHTGKGSNIRTWYYSATIKIALRTKAFDPTLRLHVDTGIRRWTSGELHTKGRWGASTLLQSTSPFVTDAPTSQKFAVAHLIWDRETREMGWRNGGTEQILNRIGALENLPAAEQLAGKSDAWIFGRDGVTAAVTYHTTMRGPDHQVGTGIMPAERSRLIRWIGQCLQPDFDLDQPLTRVLIGGKASRSLTKLEGVPKGKKDQTDAERIQLVERQEAVHAANAEISRANAVIRRHQLAAAVDGRLSVVLLYQGDGKGMRDRLLATVERLLDLPHQQPVSNDTWTWDVGDLTLTIYARPLGRLGAVLGQGSVPRRGRKHDEAVATRRKLVASAMEDLAEEVGDSLQLALIELDGAKAFNARTTDPKFAIRMGCADAGMVSQFIRPDEFPGKDLDKEEASNQHRAEAAWDDCLRQLGVRFVPQHRLKSAIPDDLEQLAFWVVKRRNDDTNTHQIFIPIAILIRPGQKHIMGKTEGMADWVPYPTLLKTLAGTNYHASPAKEDEQKERLAAFIRSTLTRFRNTQTLIVTEAHNIRYRLTTVQNAHMLPNHLQLGELRPQKISLFGKKMRLVRICGNDRLETPESWAFEGDSIGISDGLWRHDDGTGNTEQTRVYYSTVDKPATHSSIVIDLAKLTPHYKENPAKADAPDPSEGRSPDDGKLEGARNYLDPSKNAWNAELLEFVVVAHPEGEDPATWAGFLHQQRHCFDDYRAALSRPLIMHVARLTNQYALPADDTLEDEGDNIDDQPEPEGDIQLAFDFES